MVGTYYVVHEIPDEESNCDIEYEEFYTLVDDIIGKVVYEEVNIRNKSFFEVTDYTDEYLVLEELFTGHKQKRHFPDREYATIHLSKPSIGQSNTIWWVEEKTGDGWQKCELGDDNRIQHFYSQVYAESFAHNHKERTRVVSQTYHHKADQYHEWDIKFEDDEITIIPNNIKNEEVLKEIEREYIDNVPENKCVGKIYTEESIRNNENGEREKEHTIVWFNTEYHYTKSNPRTAVKIIN